MKNFAETIVSNKDFEQNSETEILNYKISSLVILRDAELSPYNQ